MEPLLSPDESRTTAWHALPAGDVAERLASPTGGLTDAEVTRRREVFGENALPAKRPPTVFEVFLRQFTSPLIYVLLAAGIISLLFADVTDAAFIFVVILLNAVIGTFQEVKAEKSATALQQMLKIRARVRRDGRETTVPAEDLVPGDRVVLESGDRVPADTRTLTARSLTVDESLLTGESHAVGKSPDPVGATLPLGDRLNMLYAGSTVMTGRSMGVVVATGQHTEIGQIAETVTASEAGKPPSSFVWRISPKRSASPSLPPPDCLRSSSSARGCPQSRSSSSPSLSPSQRSPRACRLP
jgi:Cation transport ATPase